MRPSQYYPEQYWEITELAVKNGTWRKDLGSKSQANSMKTTYQNWRAALQAEGQMEKFFMAARIVIRAEGTFISLRDRNRTGLGAILEQALEKERKEQDDITKLWKERK